MTNAPSRAFWCFAPIYRRLPAVESRTLVVESYAHCTNKVHLNSFGVDVTIICSVMNVLCNIMNVIKGYMKA